MSAVAAARTLKTRVEVTSKRSETTTRWANPDGTLSEEQHVRPIRVARGDGWVPVDTTLATRPDGTVAPKATTVDLSFSGGGEQPLATASRTSTSFTLGWPGKLPKPTLTGDTATYPEVMPGVDLRVRADAEGFSEVLVVKTREAASNPALAKVKFTTRTQGLTLASDPAGNLTATDAAGSVVFRGPTPKMWDSSAAGSGNATKLRAATAAPAETAPAGARHAPLGIELKPGELSLVPDQKLLTGPDTVYPVHIDPWITLNRGSWTSVWKQYPGTNYLNANDIARVGYESDTGQTNRSFFQFGVGSVAGKQILSATFKISETYSWSCNARPVELWHTGVIDGSTTWTKQPAWYSNQGTLWAASGYSGDCPALPLEWNLTSLFQSAASGGWNTVAVGLKASNESDAFGWKKFDNNPAIVINYNTSPNIPAGLSAEGNFQCVSGLPASQRPHFNGSQGISLGATISDPDASVTGENVKATFGWSYTNGGFIAEVDTAYKPSGTPVTTTIPATALRDGEWISWRVKATDASGATGPWSGWCDFVVDRTPPKAPIVTSPDFIEDDYGPGLTRKTATFTFRPDGDTDVAEYVYGLSDPPATSVKARSDGTADVPVTVWSPDMTAPGPQDLYVRARDKAGNIHAGSRKYHFTASEPEAELSKKPGDVNGNGVADITARYTDPANGAATTLDWISKPDGVYDPVQSWTSGKDAGYDASKIRHVTGDFTGDGRSDVAIFREAAGKLYVSILQSNSNGYTSLPETDAGLASSPISQMKFIAGDFNADGKSDAAMFFDYGNASASAWMWLSGGTSLGLAKQVWSQATAGYWDMKAATPIAGDFNGDGKADIAAFYNYGGGHAALWEWISDGAGGFSAMDKFWEQKTGWYLDNVKVVTGDFDGNGTTDLAHLTGYADQSWKIWTFISNKPTAGAVRNTWRSPVSWHDHPAWYADPARMKITASDYNGDGKADIVAYYNYDNSDTGIWTHPSTGTSFNGASSIGWRSGSGKLDWNRLVFG
ncbi:FG-GAP-like repeat-containing protein [Longispora albida]|uniref:FG-GAP-like repeat-containing protein n=1 Tax=Longispora albida TaxID=203523 RepID=UPI000374D326|nr:FG-GAP-like repeat-containing protein [Longispora albida]